MTVTVDKLALAFRKALRQGGEPLADAVREQAVVRYGRKFTEVALRRLQQVFNAEHAAQKAEYERECAHYAFAKEMFDGLPRSTTLAEACAIKASQGDESARHYLEIVEKSSGPRPSRRVWPFLSLMPHLCRRSLRNANRPCPQDQPEGLIPSALCTAVLSG
jgi:hypothetical protein